MENENDFVVRVRGAIPYYDLQSNLSSLRLRYVLLFYGKTCGLMFHYCNRL